MKQLSAILIELGDMISKLNFTLSVNQKKTILGEYARNEEVLTIFEYVLNTFKKFNITSKNIEKYRAQGKDGHTDYNYDSQTSTLSTLTDLLDELMNRTITGHKALDKVCQFIDAHIEHESIILKIIDKDLGCRVGVKDFNKVYPSQIPTFDVALAESHWKIKNLDKLMKDGSWFWSRKIDGLRLVTIYDNGDVQFFSRSGKEYLTLEAYKQPVRSFVEAMNLDTKQVVLDGELATISVHGEDNFKQTVSQSRKKGHQITDSTYIVFDVLTLEEFSNKTSQTKLSDRFARFPKNFESDMIKILEQNPLNWDKIDTLQETMTLFGWEGLMFRRDATYQGKRSKDIVKYKLFMDDEFVVKDIVTEDTQMIVDGKNTTAHALKSLVIEYKGNLVYPGSGFTNDEKLFYAQNPSEIIGKTVTIQYKQETIDENGIPSLQFPVFKGIRESGD